MAGRGFGKTRTGCEYIRTRVEGDSPHTAPKGAPRSIAIIGRTKAEASGLLVNGPSGILARSPKGYRPAYVKDARELTWPNGIKAVHFSSADPEGIPGWEGDLAWCDELAKWTYPQETWDHLQFALRLPPKPQAVITTTPRPIKLLKTIRAMKSTVVSHGTTFDNADNLAPDFFESIVDKYRGTRLGRQELEAELLEDVPGALWQRKIIDDHRVDASQREAIKGRLRRIVVAIDPAATSGEDSDWTGIVVAGKADNGEAYVLADLTCRETPHGWARIAIQAYEEWGADRIVAEVNHGGEMVAHTIRTVDPKVPYKAVHASRGKVARAEPVAALYEQKRVHHVGALPELEDQMCEFTTDFDPRKAGFSPDRVDALVWALTEVMLGPERRGPSIRQL